MDYRLVTKYLSSRRRVLNGIVTELRDDVDCETIDILRDPEEFKKQLELQSIRSLVWKIF